MRKLSIRGHEIYSRHAAINDPDEHAEVSIAYAVKAMEEIKNELEDRDLAPDYCQKLQDRIESTKAYLP